MKDLPLPCTIVTSPGVGANLEAVAHDQPRNFARGWPLRHGQQASQAARYPNRQASLMRNSGSTARAAVSRLVCLDQRW